jgi:hypothetical protein
MSEVGSETAVMVYATLANSKKTDTTVLNTDQVAQREERPFPTPPSLPPVPENVGSGDERFSDDERSSVKSRSRASSRATSSRDDNRSDDELSEEEVTAPSPPKKEESSEKTGIFQYLNKSNPQPTVVDLPQNISPPSYSDAELLEKQSLLIDLQRLRMQGIKLSKDWTLNDRVEDMTFEVRRHTLHMDEMSNVSIMKDGLRIMCTGIEMLNNRIGLLDLDGWSSEACRDLDKHDANLCKIYRKYWRRSQSSSPELDIATSMLASMGMFHFKKKMNKNIKKSFAKETPMRRSKRPDTPLEDDDDEAPPP